MDEDWHELVSQTRYEMKLGKGVAGGNNACSIPYSACGLLLRENEISYQSKRRDKVELL